jgi:hypothetical protein
MEQVTIYRRENGKTYKAEKPPAASEGKQAQQPPKAAKEK